MTYISDAFLSFLMTIIEVIVFFREHPHNQRMVYRKEFLSQSQMHYTVTSLSINSPS